jgi:hypothetical protein
MLGQNLIRVVSVFLWACALFAPASIRFASAAEPAASSQCGVLLLTDGGVLTGQISKSADRYVVIEKGSEISVPAVNVATICDTLEDAYIHQRNGLQGATADAHLTLADWCLRFELFPQAAQELLAARGLDARSPRLELLERRLAVADRPAPLQKPTPASAANSPPAQTEEAKPALASARDLPDGVVERFTRKVQPLLVNNCTLSGCHRPGGPQPFQLDRAILHGMANRRSTMTNMAAVLAQIDHERPKDSPLLTIPRRDHGGMNHPIFGPRQSSQFQQLVEWVAMVTESPSEDEPAALDAPTATAQKTESPAVEPLPLPPRWREPVMRVAYDKDGKPCVPTEAEQAAAIQSAAENSAETTQEAPTTNADDSILPPFTPSQLRYGMHARVWQPKDPFDPEIFNRQARPAAPAPLKQPVTQRVSDALRH